MLGVAPLGSGQQLGAKVLKAGAMSPSPHVFCIEEKGGAEPGGQALSLPAEPMDQNTSSRGKSLGGSTWAFCIPGTWE